jgi:PIN like domain
MADAGAELRFFLDRGLGSRIVPGRLRDAGWLLTTMDERYGVRRSQAIADIEWIEEATARGEVLLCKDLAIARNRLEAETVYRTNARVFGLSNANLSGPDAAACYLLHAPAIAAMATRALGPYVVAVSARGLRRRPLNLG